MDRITVKTLETLETSNSDSIFVLWSEYTQEDQREVGRGTEHCKALEKHH